VGAIEEFQNVLANRHQYAKDWKERTGGKAIGGLCTYVPNEIIYAAGMLPVRILGSHEVQDITDRYLFPTVCPFCRDTLAQGLKGRYDFLDGIVMGRTCMHIQGTYDNWRNYIPTPFKKYIWMPGHVWSSSAKSCLAGEYKDFVKDLEEFFGIKITNEALDEAIDLYNTQRQLQREVYEYRKQEEPPITGAEAMEMVIAGQLMDVKEHIKFLKQLLEELPDRQLDREVGIRLMMVGSEMTDVEFVRKVEELNCTFVIDEHCSGSRVFWDDVVPQDDRVAAIADRYIDRWPCPAIGGAPGVRFKRILEFAKQWDVQGVLLYQQKWCDPHEFDIPPLTQMFKEHDIPTLTLEFDVTVPFGQFRTRIEAFIEMAELEVL